MNRTSSRSTLDVCLVAGGTGGHIFPAIAVATALLDCDAETGIVFVTDSRPSSLDAVRRAGYEPKILPIEAGIHRDLAPRAIIQNLAAVLAIVRSLIESWIWLRKTSPSVVVGFGSYVSVPMILSARALGIPVLVHEQNAHAGLANQMAARFGARCAVSVEGTNLRNAIVTGNPVRKEIANVVRVPSEPPLVAFVGASLGSEALNSGALGLYDKWRHRTDIELVLVTGPGKFAACQSRFDALRRDGDALAFHMTGFEHDMAALYTRATLMVTRGGGSVWELAASGMPAIIVPWPLATEDHQTANARACAAAGGAIHLSESECTTENLERQINTILDSRELLIAMGVSMHKMSRPNAAADLASVIKAHRLP